MGTDLLIYPRPHPRSGSGKTFTAITAVYRLLEHAGAQRVLFLVDTKNMGNKTFAV